MNQEADPAQIARMVEQHVAYHAWNDDKIVEVIGSQMSYFSREFLQRVFSNCGISGYRASAAMGNLLTSGMLEIDPATGTFLPSYRMPRAMQESVLQKLITESEPELAAASSSLSTAISNLPKGPYRDFGEEALLCISAKAFRSSIVMAWNLAIDHLIAWILDDSSRLDAFNAAWTSEWKDKKAKIHNTAVCGRADFESVKEAVVLRIAKKVALIDKANTDLLEEALRKRNQAAHPSVAINFEAPIAAGHVHALVTFVTKHQFSDN